MVIVVHNTRKIVNVNGVPARIWEGETESGIKVIAFITRLACPVEADQSQFEKELLAVSAPTKEVEALPLALVL